MLFAFSTQHATTDNHDDRWNTGHGHERARVTCSCGRFENCASAGSKVVIEIQFRIVAVGHEDRSEWTSGRCPRVVGRGRGDLIYKDLIGKHERDLDTAYMNGGIIWSAIEDPDSMKRLRLFLSGSWREMSCPCAPFGVLVSWASWSRYASLRFGGCNCVLDTFVGYVRRAYPLRSCWNAFLGSRSG
jgi:hypothetical protein